MKKLLFAILSVVFITSCADEEKGPILTFDKATIGSYIRYVNLTTGEFDLDNASTSALDYEVDFVDKDNGNNVKEYVLDVQFLDNTPGNGDNSVAKQEYKVYSSSEFGTSSNGNKGIRVMIPLTDVLSATGLSLDQVTAGDNFAFFGKIRTNDGVEYASSNTTGTVRGSAFGGYFDFNGKLTCPQSNDVFVGDYTLSYDGDAGLGYGVPYPEGTVTITAVPGSSTLREFSSIVLPGIGGFGPYTSRFDLVCDKTEFVLMDSNGLGCGGGGILFGAPKDANGLNVGAPVDLTDDSQFTLIINEGFGSGGCAGQTGATMTRVVLTKN